MYTRLNMDYMLKQKEVENIRQKLNHELAQVNSMDLENLENWLVLELKNQEENKILLD